MSMAASIFFWWLVGSCVLGAPLLYWWVRSLDKTTASLVKVTLGTLLLMVFLLVALIHILTWRPYALL